jgi:hypothetical protein
MAINHKQNANSAANLIGQGIRSAVCGCQALALRAASVVEAVASGLFLPSGYWHALSLKRMPGSMTPATVTCRPITDRRHQRHQRWLSGVVVVDPGTVGVV